MNEEKAHEEGINEMRADIYRILGLKDIPSNDGEIISYWNDCVTLRGEDYDYQLYDFDEPNLDELLVYYDYNHIARMFLNIDNRFNVNRKYFYITNDYRICTTDNIWEHINLPMLYDYIKDEVRFEKYGKVWDASQCHMKEEEEILVCKMENGDEIWVNAEKSYFVLYTADINKPVYLHIYG